ncbi:MAG TPA: NAD(P)-dependent oxidoreductase [Acidimicrobiales bacterium]|nr:NAD(P)-dependent oxidoreductase [Acidimicrobiales bacterium]
MSPVPDRVGLVGVGAMGAGMWRRLRSQGVTSTVFDVRPEAMDALAAEGAPVAESAGDVAAVSDVVLISVPRSEHVLATVSGPTGIGARAAAGSLVIDLTSGAPGLSRQVAAVLAASRIDYVDAGVSGGVQGAESGALRIMVGGDDAAFSRAEPLLKLLGPNIWHCGPVGAGHAMKTLLNLSNQTKMIIEMEALLIGRKAGLDPKQVGEVLGMSAWSHYLLGPSGRRPFGFAMSHYCKDFDVAVGLATELGVPAPVGAAAQQLMRGVRTRLSEDGHDPDIIEYVGDLERAAGVTLDD